MSCLLVGQLAIIMATADFGTSQPDDNGSESGLIKTIRRIAASEEEAKGIIEWILNTELRIVVMGKTGVGKSTLLNTFLGINVFEEGDTFAPVTQNVKECKYKKKGVSVIVWDCPGLQDGTGKEELYLKELKCKTERNIHLMLYCVDMTETKSDLHCGTAIDAITLALGKDIWKHTALVLTFANLFESRFECDEPEEKKKLFTRRVNEWQDKLQQKLKSIDGIEKSTIEAIKVMPAGLDGREPLCGQKDWLSDLWAEMLKKVKEEVQQTIITLNQDRFCESNKVDDEDFIFDNLHPADLHTQPIVLTPSVKEVLGFRRLDLRPSTTTGTRIKRMKDSVVSFFVGAKEAIATALVSMYRKRIQR